MRDLSKKLKKRRGFTLIEMIAVVCIIAILLGVVGLKVSTVQKSAREKADYSSAQNIATAYYMAVDDGKTITNVNDLVTNGYLQSAPKAQSVDSDFTIDTTNESLSIKAGDKVFYPKTQEDTSKDK